MSVIQIVAWLQAGSQLIAAGAATAEQIKGFIKSLHPGLPDADLNALLDAIIASAARHKRLADLDAGVTA
jgi:hypothetical protein